jgi:hypothetical protein
MWDQEAKDYVASHLRLIEKRANGWEAVFRCDLTEHTWLEDYPHGEEHGGGPLRLRRIS